MPDPMGGDRGDAWIGVGHGETDPGLADQLQIVEAVADRCNLTAVDAPLARQALHHGPLVHAGGEDFQHVGR